MLSKQLPCQPVRHCGETGLAGPFLAVFVLLLGPAAGQARIVERFDRGMPRGWRVENGSWQVTKTETLLHVGDRTFSANVILTPYRWRGEGLLITVRARWLGGGFFEDGIVWGYRSSKASPKKSPEPALSIATAPGGKRMPGRRKRQVADGVGLTPTAAPIAVAKPAVGKPAPYNLAVLSSWHSGSARVVRTDPFENDTANLSVREGRWYELRLVVRRSGRARLYVDGKLRVDGRMRSRRGYVGLGGWKGQYGQRVEFDDFTLRRAGRR